eukprot:TRINITY_DN17715_c0_g1_i1.p1 TRINITY_DN17715_c0_g1~~TRINITY_DN17715_c0_g1_i1.p1  ORF type:complete len:138 (+),score=10.01 TRINITY_DN17715_c0_g1_i1:233-646(+)
MATIQSALPAIKHHTDPAELEQNHNDHVNKRIDTTVPYAMKSVDEVCAELFAPPHKREQRPRGSASVTLELPPPGCCNPACACDTVEGKARLGMSSTPRRPERCSRRAAVPRKLDTFERLPPARLGKNVTKAHEDEA